LATLLKANPVGIESGAAKLRKEDRSLLQSAAWQQFAP